MRKITSITLLALSAAALAACGQSASDNAGGGAESAGKDALANAAEVAFQMQPGKYRTTVTITKLEIPGMPGGMGDQMRAMMSKAVNHESCVSPEQAKRGVEIMKEQMARGQCQFDKFEASGGKIDSVFTCKTAEGMQMRAESTGTYSETGSTVSAKGEMTGPGGVQMRVEQAMVTERIGDCA
jgi:hypothetical protein